MNITRRRFAAGLLALIPALAVTKQVRPEVPFVGLSAVDDPSGAPGGFLVPYDLEAEIYDAIVANDILRTKGYVQGNGVPPRHWNCRCVLIPDASTKLDV